MLYACKLDATAEKVFNGILSLCDGWDNKEKEENDSSSSSTNSIFYDAAPGLQDLVGLMGRSQLDETLQDCDDVALAVQEAVASAGLPTKMASANSCTSSRRTNKSVDYSDNGGGDGAGGLNTSTGTSTITEGDESGEENADVQAPVVMASLEAQTEALQL